MGGKKDLGERCRRKRREHIEAAVLHRNTFNVQSERRKLAMQQFAARRLIAGNGFDVDELPRKSNGVERHELLILHKLKCSPCRSSPAPLDRATPGCWRQCWLSCCFSIAGRTGCHASGFCCGGRCSSSFCFWIFCFCLCPSVRPIPSGG